MAVSELFEGLAGRYRRGQLYFEMRDYATRRKKKLDLVISRPSGELPPSSMRKLGELGDEWGVLLTPSEAGELEKLPLIVEGPVTGSGVLVALEAKATMTAHGKARPRLYDELNSSQATVHGSRGRRSARWACPRSSCTHGVR